MNYTDLTYRTTAAQSASGLSLLIALYDTLARDLRRAADAQRAGDLEARSRELNHAVVVVGVLENWIDAESGALAQKLVAFYSKLRRKVLEAQAKQSAEMLEEQMAETLKIREIWQQINQRGEQRGDQRPEPRPDQRIEQRVDQRGAVSADVEILPPARNANVGVWAAHMERRQLSWSA